MAGKEATSNGETTNVKFDEKVFGERKPTPEVLQNWRDKGWLSEDGICKFPREVEAFPSGWKARLPPQFFDKATEDQIAEAIEKGWILFADGNGDYFTLKEYIAKYPEFPDPEFVLRLLDRFPPKKVVSIGKV